MADVVGYSRLMAADEEGTLAQLKANRRELIIPKESEYRGRTVKLMGDGALMEFGSVTDALNFAIDIQGAIIRQPGADQYHVGFRRLVKRFANRRGATNHLDVRLSIQRNRYDIGDEFNLGNDQKVDHSFSSCASRCSRQAAQTPAEAADDWAIGAHYTAYQGDRQV